MSKHDLKCKELQVVSIVPERPSDPLTSPAIPLSGVLRQTSVFAYGEMDLIPLWLVKQMIQLGTGASKTKLDVSEPLNINWQTDLITGDPEGRTFAQKHGDSIGSLVGHYLQDGSMTPYNPEYTFTLNGDGTINTLNLIYVQEGTITII